MYLYTDGTQRVSLSCGWSGSSIYNDKIRRITGELNMVPKNVPSDFNRMGQAGSLGMMRSYFKSTKFSNLCLVYKNGNIYTGT
ncbi:hypothetical protein HNQ80_000543 [Anaerosolibacter carboniphilus]|uniref:Uncharacterized protein n=1 Tax=Anaerosolibacter carboniphilus TaxID=1417629 RepID=A0A841KM35_9FIRM|nr:hypothetical protein [Anaerosolibacter carboniphilus]